MNIVIDLSWTDGVMGFVAGMIVMAAVIIIGMYISREKKYDRQYIPEGSKS